VTQKQDFLNVLGELALGSRLKRLSDLFVVDATKVYRAFGFELQPKWFTLLKLLHVKEQVSVVNAAEQLGLSQPAISQFVKELVAQEIIISSICNNDSRKRQLSLTKKGQTLINKLQPMWAAVDKAATQLCYENGNDFYHSLLSLEQALANKPLIYRVLKAHNDG
jgi:DNA-binding MarR family transcriptional regulator